MKRFEVEYESGQSRHGDEGIDYMLAVVDGVELYAEAPPGEDETATYDDLKAAILEQATQKGIDPATLVFVYDTTAEAVSTLFGDDGQRFTSLDGDISLEDACLQHGADEQSQGDLIRYLFADGSAIVVTGAAWDIEGPAPYTQAGLDAVFVTNPWTGGWAEIDKHELTDTRFDGLVALMDDDIREELHARLAPCSNWVFWANYIFEAGPEAAGKIWFS